MGGGVGEGFGKKKGQVEWFDFLECLNVWASGVNVAEFSGGLLNSGCGALHFQVGYSIHTVIGIHWGSLARMAFFSRVVSRKMRIGFVP